MTANRKNIRRSSFTQLAIGLAIIVVLNLIGSFAFYRLDLTADKRYTLSPTTRKMLKELDGVVTFKVYLEGEFPAGFQRLRNETREMLNQFRAYSKNIQFEFIDPSAGKDKNQLDAMYMQLAKNGLNATDLQVKDKAGTSRKIIFPGALVSYHGKEMPMDLLLTQVGKPPSEVLNNSVQALEFGLINVIRKLSVTEKPKIAFIEGHGELAPIYTASIESALSEYYDIDHIRIDGQPSALAIESQNGEASSKSAIENKYKAIVIAKPDSAFSKNELDKFLIDQFIMRGGKVLWLVDPVYAEMDSLRIKESTLALARDLNLEDMLFNYGVRLNGNLVVDMNSLPIPVVIDQKGNQKLIPWLFFPLLVPTSNNPIVRNLSAIKTEFVSSLDTVEAPGVAKTILLSTSRYSRVLNSPVTLSLSYLYQEPDPQQFNQPYQTVAVLLEGEFTSVFMNRIPAEFAKSSEMAFPGKSTKTAMIVVADGDVIKNQLQPGELRPTPLPLGYDRYTGQQFGNKDFILNAMNYLCDDSGLLSVRSREVKLRALDASLVESQRLKWQLVNLVVPVLLVLAFAFAHGYWRKKKFTGIY
ncbi:MAG: gliding motility-associated ABC transporter substrate-binding protein GldG [Bacteroidales bacterium]|nr:gliding motility-associated ABC transporter substrate-binding protein GldG [Bacteroidales bacterium]